MAFRRPKERSPRLEINAFPDASHGVHLKLRAKTVQGKVGRGVASLVRKSVRRGVTPDGQALPRGEDGGRPFRDSGELLRSIKFKKGLVSAWGPHSRAGQLSAGGVMGVVIFGHRNWTSRNRRGVSPFDAYSPAVQKEAGALATKEIQRQLAKGQAKLTFGGGRSSARGGATRFTRRRR